MEIKAGDKVRIKSWEAMESEYGLDEDGDIARWPFFTEAMKRLCGKELVSEMDAALTGFDDADDYVRFSVENESWDFATWMVEEVISGN